MLLLNLILLIEVTFSTPTPGYAISRHSDWWCLWKRYRFQAFPHFAQTKYRGYVQSQRPPEPLTLIGLDFEGLYRALPL